jgi:hypothetical protein
MKGTSVAAAIGKRAPFDGSKPLFLLYAAPAVTMLGLHAVIANPSTRYNLILIGPFAAGAAWLIARMMQTRAAREAPQPLGG